MLCFYAFVNAVKSLVDGGRELEFGWAIVYALIVSVICFFIFFKQRRLNRRIESELIGLDTKSWLMSACISSALFVAFVIAWMLDRAGYSHLTPYVDPGVLALLTLALIPIPVATVVAAMKEVLLITPDSLDNTVEQLMERLTAEYGFVTYSNYATRISRGLFVEIHIVLPESMENAGIRQLDRIREEISRAIGESGPDRWLTVAFTRDTRWI